MSLAKLVDLLNDASAVSKTDPVIIDATKAEALEIAGLQTVLDFLPDGELRLALPDPIPDEAAVIAAKELSIGALLDGGLLREAGVADSLIEIEATGSAHFVEVDGQLRLELSATPSAKAAEPWKFEDSFSALAFFDALTPTKPQFVVASSDDGTGGNINEGLNLVTEIDLTSEPIKKLNKFVGTDVLTVKGTIDAQGDLLIAELAGPSASIELGFLPKIDVQLSLVAEIVEGETGIDEQKHSLALTVSMPFGTNTLSLAAAYDLGSGKVSFSRELSSEISTDAPTSLDSLEDLDQLAKGTEFGGAFSPEALELVNGFFPQGVQLEALDLELQLEPLVIDRFGLGLRVAADQEVDFIGVGVSDVGLSFDLQGDAAAAAPKSIAAGISGQIAVPSDAGNVLLKLAASGSGEDFKLSAELAEESTIPLADLTDHFSSPDALDAFPEDLSSIEVNELDLKFGLADRSFTLDLASTSNWEVLPEVTLESLELDLTIERPESAPLTLDGEIRGAFDLGGVDLKAAAKFAVEAGSKPELELSATLQAAQLGAAVGGLGDLSLPSDLSILSDATLNFVVEPFEKTFSFDGAISLAAGKYPLLGVTLSLDDTLALTLDLRRAEGLGGNLETKLLLKAAVPSNGFAFTSDFAWNRDLPGAELRELHTDEDKAPTEDAPISLAVRPLDAADPAAGPTEIILIDATLGSRGKTTFLRNPDGTAFRFEDWKLTLGVLGLQVDLSARDENGAIAPAEVPATGAAAATDTENQFTLPFLKEEPSPEDPSGNESPLKKLGQRIQLGKPQLAFPGETSNDKSIGVTVPIIIKIGEMELESEIPFELDLETFAFRVTHGLGIKVFSDQEKLARKVDDRTVDTHQLFGLSWEFFGAEQVDGRFHHFTLATQDFGYQLQQADGARIEISYTKASRDPIVFIVSNFALSPKGLTVTAEVSDRPARLNGIDTEYRFAGSSIQIVENVVKGFTLSGSGPLPPKLVGDATADISLQFEERDGDLELVAGAAKIEGDLLDCKSTRFQFKIDALGLQFVNDEQFHLYFTLTGTARFVLGKGDSKSGALAMLPNIEIELIECPLTGDASVIAKHVSFLIELPKPITFPFLGAYEYELRAIGFLPQFEVFDDAAMLISGQLKFAQGKGDVHDDRPDAHKLYIGLPEEGGVFPRLHMDSLPMALAIGDAFKLDGVVEFFDEADLKGFQGQGVLEIKGLPPIAAAFGFFRVRKTPDAPFVRAWFIFLEVRQISFKVPFVEMFLREIGLGFGYRYTLTGIKIADEKDDLKELLGALREVSRTQGDLARIDAWARDIEDVGQDPRFTIVLRAMFAQMSAAKTPLAWNQKQEEDLACAYLFDVVAAVRSDLTIFMTVRAWINTSYGYFVKARNDGEQLEPLFSGFVLLTPRKKRLLAQVSSNPDGFTGHKPPMPEIAQQAIKGAQFSATLLIEPGLLHFELGWPNMLRWTTQLGPLSVDQRGGFIFRVTESEVVIGISYMARGRLEIDAGVDLGLVGASLYALADVSYGGRFIAVLRSNPAVYGAVGLEVRIEVRISLWIKIPLLFFTLELSFNFNFELGLSASVEIGMMGSEFAIAGRGTVSVKLMGHSLEFSVNIAADTKSGGGTLAAARTETSKYLALGLEATDVEPVPGVVDDAAGSARVQSAGPARALRGNRPVTRTRPAGRAGAPGDDGDGPATPAPLANLVGDTSPEIEAEEPPVQEAFSQPDYSTFVIRNDDNPEEEFCYFVLLPAAQKLNGVAEVGFLPPPPLDVAATQNDFEVTFPAEDAGKTQRFDPLAAEPGFVDVKQTTQAWKAHWEGSIEDAPTSHELEKDKARKPETVTVAQYLKQAFVVDLKEGVHKDDQNLDLESFVAIGDPRRQAEDAREELEDHRVQNPSDAAFESAVRGAVEQFEGSPFFKLDDKVAYDKSLKAAFDPKSTIYSDEERAEKSDGSTPSEQAEQIQQVRGMIINSLVRDLQDFQSENDQDSSITKTSIAFHLGLVFRIKRDDLTPDHWLNDPTAPPPTLRQRKTPAAASADSEALEIRTFNVRWTDFHENPPEFREVRQYTDAGTVAVAWKLAWDAPPEGLAEKLTASQRDPDHHLEAYEVRRREISGRTPEAVFRVKPADVLHREKTEDDGGQARVVTQTLRARFQLVDHFRESPAELAALPIEGRRYIYTITPIDIAGRRGRPLSLLATRFPDEPPRVPVDGEIRVEYDLTSDVLDASFVQEARIPDLLEPAVEVTWSEPKSAPDAPRVPIDRYRLVFRREKTLPIGSYGLDSSTQRPAEKLLPVSNARPVASDIKIELKPDGRRGSRRASLTLDELKESGVFPKGPDARKGDPALWRPEAWRVFFQTISKNGVPSALAPVQIVLRVTGPEGSAVEERRPAELEWLPRPLRLDLLPPEDMRATVGLAHVPMPTEGARFAAADALASLSYRLHPKVLSCVRLQWNQGPSEDPDVPRTMTAGFDLLELDVDANTTETFADADRLAGALREIQEVQMLPADELLTTPADTLTTAQWEAWYPSTVERLNIATKKAISGADNPLSPWFSFRESTLVWPEWPGWDSGPRPASVHPVLERVTAELGEDFLVDLQVTPPYEAGTLSDLLRSTAPDADNYGWGILQRFGLSMTLSLRQKVSGTSISGDALLEAVDKAVEAANAAEDGKAPLATMIEEHLFVEFLFQPSQSVALSTNATSEAADLLALVQLSLRPVNCQVENYRAIEIEAPGGEDLIVRITAAKAGFSLVDQGDSSRGQVEVAEAGIDYALKVPLAGRTAIFWRGVAESAPTAEIIVDGAVDPVATSAFIKGITERSVTDPISTYFTKSPEVIAKELAIAPEKRSPFGKLWDPLRLHLVALNGTESPPDKRIVIPSDEAGLAAMLEGVLPWLQRFFDHGSSSANSAKLTTDEKVIPAAGDAAPGPFLATAYPRVASPAHLSPDAAGRLTYDHLLHDRWAHNYRYFVRPRDRYGLLWQSLLRSPKLFPEAVELGSARARLLAAIDAVHPDPETGGLDVVVDRTKEIQKPLILRSGRLDAKAEPGLAVPPGSIWEVILAQHGEQEMVERNQTLTRRLTYRQVAFTLMRRLTDRDWPEELSPLLTRLASAGSEAPAAGDAEEIKDASFVILETQTEEPPELPGPYSEGLDHLDLDHLSDDDARSLDLPLRLGRFNQGALALQWEGLPFYYEHQLVAVAQAATVVSEPNAVVQRDFEYRSPLPEAFLTGRGIEKADGESSVTVLQEIWIPLARFWDSLPESAQQRWPLETPRVQSTATDFSELELTFSAFPDPEVVYQLIALFDGNIEVQAEVFMARPDASTPTLTLGHRQLGKKVLVESGMVIPPQDLGGAEPRAFRERFAMQMLIETPGATGAGQHEALLTTDPGPALEGAESAAFRIETLENYGLRWQGPMTEADRQALEDFADQESDASLTSAVAKLVAASRVGSKRPFLSVVVPLEKEAESEDVTPAPTPDQPSPTPTSPAATDPAGDPGADPEIGDIEEPLPEEPRSVPTVPQALAGQLAVVSAKVVIEGPLSSTAVRQLFDRIEDDVDRDAVVDLHHRSNAPLPGIELFIATRRGSASPTSVADFAVPAPTVIDFERRSES